MMPLCSWPHEDVVMYCASLDVSVSAEQVRFVLSQTKQQATNPLWFKMRAGRVTASNFHAACHTAKQKPSISLFKRTCTPTHMQFKSQATDWGTQHEEVGRKQYMAQAVSQHEYFDCQGCGLVLSSDYHMFGASPYGLVECKCCGLGCLEIKYSFILKHV